MAIFIAAPWIPAETVPKAYQFDLPLTLLRPETLTAVDVIRIDIYPEAKCAIHLDPDETLPRSG